jgi:V8-like Glu-specific endopeptidase
VAHPVVPVSPGIQWTQGGLVARTTGRVFFTLGGVDYACSGSAIASPNGATVLTAAHCVEGSLGYATHWVFVPGYDQGRTPYGIFPAVSLAALPGFSGRTPDITQDVAFVKVGANADGQTLAQAVGGQQIGFDGTAVVDARALGFPAQKPYDGLLLEECAGPVAVDARGSGDIGLDCGMTGGSSGGPWLTDLDPDTGVGRVVSVTSFGYTNFPGRLYGPPLGPAAQQLFATVSTL